jgi:thiosulfate dehydrogenase [quinone] large subunit
MPAAVIGANVAHRIQERAMQQPNSANLANPNAASLETLDRRVIFVLRLLMGWTFLYAGAWQILQNYDTGAFLDHVDTFHGFFALFARPEILPVTDFLVKWGHLLIGLSLISGLLVRVSGPFAVLLMITYYFAHMKFPFISDHLSLLFDYHLVYATVLVYLIAHRAGHVWGLDGLLEEMRVTERHPALRPLV